MIEHDDDAEARADAFLSELVPQVADRLADRHATAYDASGGQERFTAWLAANADGKPERRTGRGPGRPDRGLGRWLRMRAGIREDVLDWVPEERARYTGLGIVILATACLAAFAMFSALATIVTVPAVALIPAALAWGWFKFSIDGWLIAGMHGISRRGNRLRIFLPRLAIAAVLAVIIAEPLTLRIFHNAVDTRARITQLSSYASQLQTCNPVSGRPGPATCTDYVLNVPGSPYALQQKLATTRQQEAQLQSAISADLTQVQKMISIAQAECAGTAGPGTTGRAGDGPVCQADWAATHTYEQQGGLAAKQKQLAGLQTSITGMIQQEGSAQQTYAARLNTAITSAVAKKSEEPARQIGILDEEAALQQLAAQSTSVLFARWLLVLILLALNFLPMLVKLISGSTAYDNLLAAQIAAEERIFLTDLRLREETTTAEKEIKAYTAETAKRRRIGELDQEKRVRNAKDLADLAAAGQAFMDLLAQMTSAAGKEAITGGTQVLTTQGLREPEDAGLT